MHIWLIVVILLWPHEVHGYGGNSYGAASGQAIRIGKLEEQQPHKPLAYRSHTLITL